MPDDDFRDETQPQADRPLAPLRDASEEPGARFVPVLRARINRRIFAADSVDFSIQVLFETLLGYLDLVLGSVLGLARRNRQEP